MDKIDIDTMNQPFGTNDMPIGFPKMMIAGPCSAESEEQVMATATALQKMGVRIFRAGIWKPRTRPGCFEGVGREGLPWLQRVQQELGMRVAVEVANAKHVEAVLEAGMDIVWIGARTSTSPFAVQEVAEALRGTDIPVLIKNPINPDIELWEGAIERFARCGVTRLAAIHRGFSSYDRTLYRNPPQWQIPIELHRRIPSLPLLCDPSHIAGKRALVPFVARQAMNLGFDGLMVESHCYPEEAWSDAAQQLTPDALSAMIATLTVRDDTPVKEEFFLEFREHLDRCDAALVDILAERMAISREIGEVKRAHGIQVFQPSRYDDMLDALVETAEKHHLDAAFLKKIFEAIHAESIVQQL